MYELTPEADRVVFLAQEEARSLGLTYITPEHLLIALIKEERGVASQVLRSLGLDLQLLQLKIKHMSGWSPLDSFKMKLRQAQFKIQQLVAASLRMPTINRAYSYSPRAEQIVVLSAEEASQLDSYSIDTEHLLLALTHQEESFAARVLVDLGIDLNRVRTQVYRYSHFK